MGRLMTAVELQVRETATLLALARRVKQRLGWKCSDTAARQRVAHMLNPNMPERHLPADCLIDVLQVTGRDDFLRELLAEHADVQLRLRDARSLRTVRPVVPGREECA